MDQIIKRVLPINRPLSALLHFDQTLQPNLSNARRHTTGFHGVAMALGVFSFNTRKTTNTLFADPRGGPVHRFFIRTGFHTFPVPTASLLIDENDAVFRPFVNSVPWTGRQTPRIGAVITNAGQVEKPGFVAVFPKSGSF